LRLLLHAALDALDEAEDAETGRSEDDHGSSEAQAA
jgi:hypothetical protein